jgi:DNA-binding NarL/FixJ family response regulator
LTSRQRQIVTCIGQQMQTRDIAATLGIASATVNKHRNHITQRLRLSNTAQLTAYCVHVVQRRGQDEAMSVVLHAAAEGACHAPLSVDATDATDIASPAGDGYPHPTLLGAREWQILQLLANGMTSKEMARHLSLSPRTISEHRRRLMRRFSVHRMVELMTLYTRIAAAQAVRS